VVADILILGLENDLDVDGGITLLRDRHPNAKVGRTKIGGGPWQAFGCDAMPDWVLGLGWQSNEDYKAINATSQASVTMQAWHEIHPDGKCRKCRPSHRSLCWACLGSGVVRVPWWVRYIDNGVRKRWELPDAQARWEAMVDVYSTQGRRCFKTWCGQRDMTFGRLRVGRAIVRAQKRWKEDHCCSLCYGACDDGRGLLCGDCAQSSYA
jgi:hypothetical protein